MKTADDALAYGRWLDGLKEGDEVAYGRDPTVTTVARFTPTLIVTKDRARFYRTGLAGHRSPGHQIGTMFVQLRQIGSTEVLVGLIRREQQALYRDVESEIQRIRRVGVGAMGFADFLIDKAGRARTVIAGLQARLDAQKEGS